VDETYQQLGVFLFDFARGQVETIAPEGYRLQDVSPDGRYLLLSRGPELYLTRQDGTVPRLVTDQLLSYSTTAAVWMGDGQHLAWIEGSGDENRLYLCPVAGAAFSSEDKTALDTGETNPVTLHPIQQGEGLAWEYGACQSGACARKGIRVAGTNGSVRVDIPGAHHPAISSTLSMLAYVQEGEATQNQLVIVSLEDGSPIRSFELPGNHLLDFVWSPDGRSLAVLNLNRSDYSGRWFDIRTFVLQPTSWTRKELAPAFGLNARVIWSADGKNLLLSGTVQSDLEYAVEMAVVDIARNKAATHQVPGLMSGEEVVLTGGLKWLPPYPFEADHY
jgi:dipeptidyl aminopeptidase/acylaminoacyl peptidase